MYFTKIRLKNFGPFFDAEFDFEPHATNWIVGETGSGKTQMVGAMLAAIVGKTALSTTAGGNGPSSVALDMRDGQISETTFLDIVETSRGKFDVSKTRDRLGLQCLVEMSKSESQRLMIGHINQSTDLGLLNLRKVEKMLPDAVREHSLWTNFLSNC